MNQLGKPAAARAVAFRSIIHQKRGSTGRAAPTRAVSWSRAGRSIGRQKKTLLETLATIKKEAEHRLGKAQSDVVIDATGIVEGVANLPGDILRAAFRSPLALLGLAGLALVFWPAISLQVRRLTK